MEQLKSDAQKVVGTKQVLRLLEEERLRRVYIAQDADVALREKLSESCNDHDVEIIMVPSMEELGQACGIHVNAATAGLLKG